MTAHFSELIELGGSVATITTAHETGLVASLSQPASPEVHAERLGLDPEAVGLVLDTLVALGVAGKRNGCIGASDALWAAAGNPLDELLPMHELWRHLPRFLRTGESYAHMDGSPAERSAAYKRVVGALGVLFEKAADDLARKLPPPGERVLDVGAGSGVWSLAMCARSPATRVTALDLPAVLPAVLDRAERLGLSDRVDTIPGDFHSIELSAATFDRIVLANVIHLESPERAASLIARAAPALRPRGELVVIDCLADEDPAREPARAVYALHLAMRTAGGRLRPRAEIERWARDAGLSSGELVTPAAPPWSMTALIHEAA